MRLKLFAMTGVMVGLSAFPAFSQTLPTCPGVDLVAPANGSHFIGKRPIMFRWSGEPVGTASRELHLASLDGSETVVPLDGRFSDTVRVHMRGDLAWAVVFLDAAGRPLCSTPIGLILAGSGGGSVVAGGASLIEPSSGASPGAAPPPRLVVGFTNNGRLVIVLQNSSYAGQYSKLVASDSYDAAGEDLMGTIGLEIHGNEAANTIDGSPGDDQIFGYGGNDTLDAGAGDDFVHGGSGDDRISDPTGGDADVLYGGDGGDRVDVVDGDVDDTAYMNEPGKPHNSGDLLLGEFGDLLQMGP